MVEPRELAHKEELGSQFTQRELGSQLTQRGLENESVHMEGPRELAQCLNAHMDLAEDLV